MYDKLQLVAGRLRPERLTRFRAFARRKLKFALQRERCSKQMSDKLQLVAGRVRPERSQGSAHPRGAN
ncbi:MAG: hypothetical protein IPM63_10935 [Acidobacteriota bacterium]|nr:MAG: hypothetical protein IPM63_10935 [Acidobacteriota bacterium]